MTLTFCLLMSSAPNDRRGEERLECGECRVIVTPFNLFWHARRHGASSFEVIGL